MCICIKCTKRRVREKVREGNLAREESKNSKGCKMQVAQVTLVSQFAFNLRFSHSFLSLSLFLFSSLLNSAATTTPTTTKTTTTQRTLRTTSQKQTLNTQTQRKSKGFAKATLWVTLALNERLFNSQFPSLSLNFLPLSPR